DDRICLFRLAKRSGPAAARNLGFQFARGEYIQFLDSDDFIHPRKLELQIERLRKTKAEWVGSNWRIVFKFGALSFPFPCIKIKPNKNELLLGTISEQNWFPLMSCIFRKSFLKKVGPWLEDDFVEDRDFRLRTLIQSRHILTVDKCLFHYNRYPFIARRNEVSFNRNAWNDYIVSNQRFIKQIEDHFASDTPRNIKIRAELETLRKKIPLLADHFLEKQFSNSEIIKDLTSFFLKSFFRNWAKLILGYFVPRFKFQMTGGDL
ncbi:MAG: glycosyltransferase family 2 protein, partial [Deltaproteobacteria bacterium]